MEKLFIKKLDDGKEFKIMVRISGNGNYLPFGTICEYLGINVFYWVKKYYSNLLSLNGEKTLWISSLTLKNIVKKIYPKTVEGKYWKKVILDLLQPDEIPFYKDDKNQETETINAESEKNSKEMNLKDLLEESKDQLEFVRTEVINLKFDLANANENIDFLEAKNKELRKQQIKLNQALGIDLLNMAQSLLNMKEV